MRSVLGDWSVRILVGHSVSEARGAVPTELPVPAVEGGRPDPTFASLVDFRPEAIVKRPHAVTSVDSSLLDPHPGHHMFPT